MTTTKTSKRSRCPDCGCFTSPWMPVGYCKRCERAKDWLDEQQRIFNEANKRYERNVAAMRRAREIRKIQTEQRKNGYRRVVRHLRTKSRLPLERPK